jgi:hypothetical protein
MKTGKLNFLLLFLSLSSYIICSSTLNSGWVRKRIGRNWKGGLHKVSASAAALILKRLGDKRSFSHINEKILKNCVHFSFLGRKLSRKFKISKKMKKNKSLRRNFSVGFVRYVLNSLLRCKIVRKSDVSYKLKRALRNNRNGRHRCIYKKAVALVKSYRGPVLKINRSRSKPGYAKFRKGKFTRKTKRNNRSKKLKRAIKSIKNLRNLLRRSFSEQQNCRNNGFKKGSISCKRANRLLTRYIRRASKVKKILNYSCQRYKKSCFKYRIGCSKMFKMCKRSYRVNIGLNSQKAIHFARVFASIITHLNK